MGLWSRMIGLAGLLLLAMLAAMPARALAGVPLQPCVGRLASANEAVPHGSNALVFDCGKDQAKYGSGDFSVDFVMPPRVSKEDNPLVLRLSSVWQDAGRLTFRYADGSERVTEFTAKTTSRYMTLGAILQFEVPASRSALTGIHLDTTGSANLRGVVLGATLMPKSEAAWLANWLVALYAGFAGLSLALLVYNFALWAAIGHRFQLLYAGMVTAISAYTFTASGLAMMLVPHLGNLDRIRVNYLMLGLSGLMAIQFIRAFFEPRVLPRWLLRAIDGSSVFVTVSAILFANLAPVAIWWLDRIYFIALGILLSLILPVLVCAWMRGSRYFWLFLLAWSAPIVTSFLRFLHGFGVVGYSFWLDNGNLLALGVEALLSSFLITSRLRELSRERDNAREGEQNARRLAATDPLTGLLNRRAFLDLAIGRRARQRLMLIDIDHFKSVNDRLGHDAGDEVLRAVAEAIQRCRPQRSLAVRLGGEEFALLLPRAMAEQCPPEALLDAVRQALMPQGMQVTVSIGYSEGQVASEEDWKRLYRLADAALYRAKADGRDRSCRATDFRAAA